MSTPQRLPIVNADDGTWGDILLQYLKKEHYDNGNPAGNAANGGHQTITVQPGTASANTAPLKFTSGTLLNVAEAGAIEFNTDKLYFTKTTGPTRQTVAAYDTSGSTGDIYYRDSFANFVKLGIGGTNDLLTVSSSLPAWTSSPTLGNTSTVTLKDTLFTLQDDGDATKQAQFQLSGITAGTTRTYILPDASTTLLATNTVTTKGDLYVATGSGVVSRLGVGTNDYVLLADSSQSTGVRWAAAPASGWINMDGGSSGSTFSAGSAIDGGTS